MSHTSSVNKIVWWCMCQGKDKWRVSSWMLHHRDTFTHYNRLRDQQKKPMYYGVSVMHQVITLIWRENNRFECDLYFIATQEVLFSDSRFLWWLRKDLIYFLRRSWCIGLLRFLKCMWTVLIWEMPVLLIRQIGMCE